MSVGGPQRQIGDHKPQADPCRYCPSRPADGSCCFGLNADGRQRHLTHVKNGPDCTCPNDDYHDRVIEPKPATLEGWPLEGMLTFQMALRCMESGWCGGSQIAAYQHLIKAHKALLARIAERNVAAEESD